VKAASDKIPTPVIDPVPYSRIQSYLQPNERLLWTGQPDPSRLFGRGDAFLIPISVMWGGFAIVWEGSVIAFGAPWFFMLWGVPFVLVGQYLIWGRFLYKRWDKRRTVYAVTDQRALILRGGSLQSVFLNQLPVVNQSARIDGSGSLEFGNPPPFAYGSWGNTGMDFFTRGRAVPAFYDIPDVAKVFALITEARRGTG
jgi:hypothetical protein